MYSVLCICMYKHIYTNRHPSASSVKGLRAPPPQQQQEPDRSDLTVRKQANGGSTATPRPGGASSSFLLWTVSVFAVVLCGATNRQSRPRPPAPRTCAEGLETDGRSSRRVEKKREVMSLGLKETTKAPQKSVKNTCVKYVSGSFSQ